MKYIALLEILILLSGCTTANLVRAPGDNAPKEYAPINSGDSTYGVVNYLNEGASFVTNARRKDAYKKMYEACNGKYKILGEASNESNPMFVQQGNITNTFTSSYVSFAFECVK